MSHSVDIRVLGPFEVVTGGTVLDLGGPQLRALLAALLVANGRAVSVGTLVDELWGEHAPHDADRTVRTYVSRLRKYLRPAADALVIVTQAPGYLVRVDPMAVDATRFERATADGRRALADGHPARAATQLAEALGLWRGAAYDEFCDLPSIDTEAIRLTQLRHDALEDRIDANLATGAGRELVAELDALTTAYPGHERLWGQLMLALYRAGRQADALRTFQRARSLLLEELGVEPSPVLAGIQQRILAHDKELLTGEPSADHHAALAAGLDALHTRGDLRTGRQHFETAYRLADQAGDATVVAEAMLGLSGLWVHEHRTATATHQMRNRLIQALAQVDKEAPQALRLRVRIAGETDYRRGTNTEILAMVAHTRSAADPIAHAEALSIAHHCLLAPDHGPLREALSLELIGESSRTGRRVDRMMGLLWHTVDLFLAGHPHAERRLGELRDALATEDFLAVGFVVSAIQVMLTIRAGRLDEAEKLAHLCAELGDTVGDADSAGWYGAHMVAIRWFQGRLEELLPMLDELVDSSTLSTVDNSYFAARAVAAALSGDRRKAASSLAKLVGNDLAELPRSSTWLVSMTGVAEAAYLLGDTATAAEVYALLSPFSDLPVMASLAMACFGSTHYPLGVAAMTMGDLDGAVQHLHTAIQHNLALAHYPALTQAESRYAEALRRKR